MLTTGEISAHLGKVYGAEISKDTVTRITDRVIEEITARWARPLEQIYAATGVDLSGQNCQPRQTSARPNKSLKISKPSRPSTRQQELKSGERHRNVEQRLLTRSNGLWHASACVRHTFGRQIGPRTIKTTKQKFNEIVRGDC